MRFAAAALRALLSLSACASSLAAQTALPAPSDSVAGVPGFDVRAYPGDSVMRAWVHPASPYYWVGDYLPAPCHRDSSFVGKYSTLAQMGWGVAAIYVGQQDFSQMPSVRQSQNGPGQPIICSGTLLTTAQGATEGADAAAKLRADGFPSRAAVFLDVEQVAAVSPALLAYVTAWAKAVLQDGRYRPGIYAAKPNVQDLYAAVTQAYQSTNASGKPAVWVSSSAGFTPTAAPAAVGLDYATVWQGLFGVAQTWNGTTLLIDVDVATSKSPGGR